MIVFVIQTHKTGCCWKAGWLAWALTYQLFQMKLLFPLLHNIWPVKQLNQGVNSNNEVFML